MPKSRKNIIWCEIIGKGYDRSTESTSFDLKGNDVRFLKSVLNGFLINYKDFKYIKIIFHKKGIPIQPSKK